LSGIDLLLGVLAVWRVTHLIASEDGPFDVVARARRFAGSGLIGQLFDCFYCLSLWVAAPFAWWMQSQWRERILLWLALSAAAILVNRVVDRIAADPPVYFEAADTKSEASDINTEEKP
jgi:hypothetical protein